MVKRMIAGIQVPSVATSEELRLFVDNREVVSAKSKGIKSGRVALHFNGKEAQFKDVRLKLLLDD